MGTLKGDRKNEILSQLDKNVKEKKEYRKVKNAWALASTKKKMPDYQLENLYLDFRQKLAKEQKTRRLNTSGYLKYAAVFILAIGLSSLFFYFQPQHLSDLNTQYTTAIAEHGQISKIILPDSSVVWLNSGTTIAYNNNFAVNNREIKLSGQAFFDVTKNKKIPLQVFCNKLEVKVLGTKFDVSAYPEDKNIHVFLESGKVEILNPVEKSFHYELNPGEMTRYDKSSKHLSLRKNFSNQFTAWKDGVLIFRDEPMSEVIPKLQRRYDIDIEVAQSDIYESVFTATIKNETLEEIFKSISYACSVQYQIIKGENLNSKTKIILTTNSN